MSLPKGSLVVGLDEVGRGPLAGPVVAAAVIWPPPENFPWVEEVRDSKKLSAKKREFLSEQILTTCPYSIKEVSVEVIDEMNILWASLYAMSLALDEVFSGAPEEGKPTLAFVDGKHSIPTMDEAGEGWLSSPIKQYTCVGGDDTHKCIGAASIIAKVYRDRLMKGLDVLYPQYGWKNNFGYGTPQHLYALREVGLSPEHRKSFKGVL